MPFLEEPKGVFVHDVARGVAVGGAYGLDFGKLGVPDKVKQREPVVDVAAAHPHGVVEVENDALHERLSFP